MHHCFEKSVKRTGYELWLVQFNATRAALAYFCFLNLLVDDCRVRHCLQARL
jgi:hypothetical protein